MNQKTYVEGFHDKKAVEKMSYHPLGSTGMQLSEISFGTGPLGGVYEDFDQEEAFMTLKEALASGINYIDTAPWYGQGKSEERLGKALQMVPRSSFYIGTKVGRYEKDINKMFNFSAEKVTASFKESLEKLKLDYVDIIQVHDIEFAPSLDIVINETLPALQKIVDEGKARFIGVTGYPVSVLKKACEKSNVKISSILSYCRNTIFDHELENYIPFFQNNDIGVINASVFSMGLLVTPGPQPWHCAGQPIKDACRKASQYCTKNGTDIATLALKHSVLTKGVSTHLLGMLNREVLKQNLESALTPFTDKEKNVLEYIKENFFATLAQTHWENVEIENYKKNITTFQ